MKVLFLTNIPSSYRVDFFNEMGKYCDLTVLFEKGVSDERNASWQSYQFQTFRGIVLQGKKTAVDKAFAPSVTGYLKKSLYDRIIVTNTATPTGMLAILHMNLHRIPYWIEGDGAFPKQNEGVKRYIKRYFIKGAAGYFSTSQMHDSYYMTYGAAPDKIYRYPFTSLKEQDVLLQAVTPEQKQALRKKYKLPTDKVITIAVGQFIHRKGFDILLDCWAKQNETHVLLLIGGGPLRKQYEEKKIENVIILDFLEKAQLMEYYQASDLFVLPTREDIWGLVINEAMANGLPVITTDKCIAGLELVRNGENGYIVPVDSHSELSEKMNTLFRQPELLRSMAQMSLKKIAPYTIENMAKTHVETIEKSLEG